MDKYDVKIIPQRWGATPWGFIEDHKEWDFLNTSNSRDFIRHNNGAKLQSTRPKSSLMK